jgi:alkanesulfonate monooxygenase SsuD/methylene tetrahydromethanopterin reductase-like flavin-dependent oxidoreductase (luciferase family)
VGSPETVRAGLQEIADGYGAQELIAVNIVYEHAARMRSYELLAQALEL